MSGLLCLAIVHVVRARKEVEAAPHVTDAYLASVYDENDVSAIRRLNDKRVVVTGIVGGQDEGMFGSSPMMLGEIEFDDIAKFDSVEDGEKVSILGTCKGRDEDGIIYLYDCRVVRRFKK